MVEKILVIGAHPDDEVLGVGGTIARHISLGNEVHVAILCTDASKRSVVANNLLKEPLEDSLKNALTKLGVSLANLYCYNFPNLRINSTPHDELVACLESLLLEIKPGHVFTHFDNDLNIDHEIIAKATNVAIRVFERRNLPHVIKLFAQYEIPSSTNWQVSAPVFVPNMYVNITESFQQKLQALQFYRQSLKKPPNPLSEEYVSALATMRGGECGCERAEAFKILRAITI